MFKKILVPLDGSVLAAKVLPKVIDMAKSMGSRVTLLHVCYWPVPTDAAVPPETIEHRAETAAARWCAKFLGEAAEELRKQGLEVNFQCVEGVPAREIIAYADANDIDLIAMATHGSGEVSWVLGSTAEKVVTHATVPTLLYRVIETRPPLLKSLPAGMP